MFNLQPDRIVLTRRTICNKKSESKCDPNSSQETAFDCNVLAIPSTNINVNPKNGPTELISLSGIFSAVYQLSNMQKVPGSDDLKVK